VHLNYSDGEYRDGVSASFDQLFLPQSPDLNSVQSHDKVWALFDRSLHGVCEEQSDRRDWTAVYYPAQVCADQMDVRPQSVRVVYRDAADNGKRAIVPAEAHLRRKSFHGLVQVSRSELSAGVRAAHGGASLETGAVACLPSRAADS
jgi:hypothetical protein